MFLLETNLHFVSNKLAIYSVSLPPEVVKLVTQLFFHGLSCKVCGKI